MAQTFHINAVGNPAIEDGGATIGFTITSLDGFAMDMAISLERLAPMLMQLYAMQARALAQLTGNDMPNAVIPIAVETASVHVRPEAKQSFLALKTAQGLEFSAVLGPDMTARMGQGLTQAANHLRQEK